MDCFFCVLGNALALVIHVAQKGLRRSLSLLSSLEIPSEGLLLTWSETEPTTTALALPRLVGPGLLGGRARVWQFGATAPANSEGAGRILATVMTVDLSIGVALKFPFVLADHLDGSL